jgi:hypothetical protein
VYDEEGNQKVRVDESDVEWVIPEDEGDVEAMMADLRTMGFPAEG